MPTHPPSSPVKRGFVLALALVLSGCGGASQQSASLPNAPATMAPGMTMNAPASSMRAVRAAAAGACSYNVALNRPAVASSQENVTLPAAAAFDGNLNTRWGSAFSDPQSLQVDLGAVQSLCGVTLQWERAHAVAYIIETSNDLQTWSPLYRTTASLGGTENLTVNGSGRYVRLTGTKRATGYGYSLFEMQVLTATAPTPPSTLGYVDAVPPVTGVVPSTANPGNPPGHYFHEFQANCAVSRAPASDDPIVYFNQPGATHSHTFLGNTTTNAATTLASLQAGTTTCKVQADKSAYWMPTMYNATQTVLPIGPQVIYYKTGVTDYTSVRPFPSGLRFVVGDTHAAPAQFLAASVEGWECGNSVNNADFPTCAGVPGADLNIRYQAPSCWDGLHLDSPDHRSHMAYPIAGACSASHPVAVVMLEFKMAFPAGADTSQVRLSSGRGYSFHYDFYNAWEPATLKALVDHCIVGALQCDARGYDQAHPEAGAALGTDYTLH